jgi:hypothetical protein
MLLLVGIRDSGFGSFLGFMDSSLWCVVSLSSCQDMSRRVADKCRHDMICNALLMRMYMKQ